MKTPIFLYFETYGCTANQNNTEIMKGLVKQAGLEITNNIDIADLLVINTCIVKEPTEKKIERRISDLYKLNKPIIVAGCMPQVRAEKLKKQNIYLLGIKHIKDINKLIRKILDNGYDEKDFLQDNKEIKLCLPKISNKKEIGITQISEGCLGNCSFCLTRKAKGSLHSYPEDKIIENIKNDLKSCKEIWLTSQDNAAYGKDINSSLPELLDKILALKGKFLIRVGMMNPENILPILNELVECYKNKKMKKFLHLPLQSGSNSILKKMNRKYTKEQFFSIVEKFRKEIPGLIFWTDIIAGFPEENESDFQDTIDAVKKLKPDFINISRYWQMKGTDAALRSQVPREIIKERVKKLNKELK